MSEEPGFLSVDQVHVLHKIALARYGGADGIREPGLFESAIMQPRNIYYYGEEDLFGIAAAYAFHIAQAQACLDGNKRTGVAAALTFLKGNGIDLDGAEKPLYEAMIAVANRAMSREDVADLLRQLAAK